MRIFIREIVIEFMISLKNQVLRSSIMAYEIDELDKKILEKLKSDSRISYGSIAKFIDRSESTVRKRINKMIENDIIKSFTIKIDDTVEGNLITFIRINPESTEFDKILEYLRNRPETMEIFKISGTFPIISKIVVNSIDELEEFIINLKELNGIKEIESNIVINKIKS
jgi:DNA-binding Lrp family transcriptional regulator